MRDVGAERYLPLSPCFIPARPRSPQSHPQASAVDRYPEIRHGEGKGITVGRATHIAVRGDDKQESLAGSVPPQTRWAAGRGASVLGDVPPLRDCSIRRAAQRGQAAASEEEGALKLKAMKETTSDY